jgi:hypothetical protein
MDEARGEAGVTAEDRDEEPGEEPGHLAEVARQRRSRSNFGSVATWPAEWISHVSSFPFLLCRNRFIHPSVFRSERARKRRETEIIATSHGSTNRIHKLQVSPPVKTKQNRPVRSVAGLTFNWPIGSRARTLVRLLHLRAPGMINRSTFSMHVFT